MSQASLVSVVTTAMVAFAILVVLWPDHKHGTRLLARWGLPDPDPGEVETAIRHLRRRRVCYPVLYPAIALLTPAGIESMATQICLTVLLGSLVAELLAQRPSGEPGGEDARASRSLVDSVPVWAIVLSGLVMAGSLVNLLAGSHWGLFAVSAGAAVGAWAITLLSVRRPAAGGVRVDATLRRRSARVAIGLGTGTCALVSWPDGGYGAWAALLVGLGLFVAIATPPQRSPVGVFAR